MDIRVHWSFVGLIALVVWIGHSGGTRAVTAGLVWLGAVFGSVLVHEFAHCSMARRRGTGVEDILLTPIGALTELSAAPQDPRDEFAIAVVGPLASFGLAVGVAVTGLVVGDRLWPPALFGAAWSTRLLWLNVVLGAFNLLPAFPMDGGRLLRSGLALYQDRVTATRCAVLVARVLAAVMIGVGIAYDFWLALVGIFVMLGASADDECVGDDRPEATRDGCDAAGELVASGPAAGLIRHLDEGRSDERS